MPLPKPHKDEKENEFISRCMGDEAMNHEFSENEQRAAVCHRQWRESRKPKDGDTQPVLHKGYQCKTEDADDANRTIVCRISTIGIDRDREILLPRGLDIDDLGHVVGYNGIVLWSHDYGGATLPLGRNQWVKVTDKEVIAKTEFNDMPFSQDVYRLYRDGWLNAWSVGFRGVTERLATSDEIKQNAAWADVRRIFDKWQLLEYSAVKIAANPEALTLAISKGLAISPDTIKELSLSEAKAVPVAPRLIITPRIIPAIVPDIGSRVREVVQETLYKMRGGV